MAKGPSLAWVPAVLVLEDIGGTEPRPAAKQLPVDDLCMRAAAYGMRAVEADGQDLEAVYEAAAGARAHAVSGKGPVLVHLRTFRLAGHYVGDPQIYRDKDEVRRLRETEDPLAKLRARLELSDADVEALEREIEAIVEGSVAFAKAGTDPNPEDALKYVYA